MSSKGHNKKRNVGLLYEFLVRTASTAVVEGNEAKSSLALDMLNKHFAPGTALHREFKLFNSLMKVQITSSAVAGTILTEARNAARDYKIDELQKAKTRLINEMNRSFNDPTLWDTPIPNYRIYATIGTLISEWREQTGRVDIRRLANYEEQLVKWLMENKTAVVEQTYSPCDGTERLAFKIALRKFNEKYSGTLLPEQKDIIRQWALSNHSGKPESIIRALKEIRESLVVDLDRASRDTTLENINKDIVDTKKKILNESLETVDDETVKRFMLYSRLRSEINTKDEEEES